MQASSNNNKAAAAAASAAHAVVANLPGMGAGNKSAVSGMAAPVSEENIRIKVRAAGPREIAIKMFTETNYDPVIASHNALVKSISEDPLPWFFSARSRLREHGPTASFPEFEGTVAQLVKAIFQKPEYVGLIEADETLQAMREIQLHSLIAIQIKQRYEWPYKATILLIEELLKFVDILARKLRGGEAPKYYHNFRYRVYLTYLLDEAYPDNIVFPTVYPIGSTFLIKVRCAPIMFLGVVDDFTHADQYDNSPLDFWAHDIQHARRLIQEDRRYYDIIVKHRLYYVKRSPFNFVPYDEFSQEMYNFTRELMNIIRPNKADDERTRAFKQLKKLLIFEVVHEKGWPITKFSMCRNIPLGYDVFPIETLRKSDDGRLEAYDDKFQDPTTLANAYNKLRKGFYDKVDSPDRLIVDPRYRTAKAVASAALELLKDIQCKTTYTFEKLLALTQDPVGAEEFTERPGTIAFPNDRNESVMAENPTEFMPLWQVEPEAPVYEGGRRRRKTARKHRAKKNRRASSRRR